MLKAAQSTIALRAAGAGDAMRAGLFMMMTIITTTTRAREGGG